MSIVLVVNTILLQLILVEILLKIRKTGIPVKLLRGVYVACKRTKSLIVSDQTIAAEGLGVSLNILAKLQRMLER